MEHIRRAGYTPHLGRKFDVRRRHQRQIVTGLVVNEVANLSREKRRWLRAVEHQVKLQNAGGYVGPKPTLTEEELNGWRSLRKMIDNSDTNSQSKSNWIEIELEFDRQHFERAKFGSLITSVQTDLRLQNKPFRQLCFFHSAMTTEASPRPLM